MKVEMYVECDPTEYDEGVMVGKCGRDLFLFGDDGQNERDLDCPVIGENVKIAGSKRLQVAWCENNGCADWVSNLSYG